MGFIYINNRIVGITETKKNGKSMKKRNEAYPMWWSAVDKDTSAQTGVAVIVSPE